MKSSWLSFWIILGACCPLFVGVAVFLWPRDPYARMERMYINAERISLRNYVLQDVLLRQLRQKDPDLYYREEFNKEWKALVALGLLAEARIPYSPGLTELDVKKALYTAGKRSGVLWGYRGVDLTNHIVMITCKPADVVILSAPLNK